MNEPRLLTVPLISDWTGPFPPAVQARSIAALEAGGVILFLGLAFRVTREEEAFLRPTTLSGRRKNISLDAAGGTLSGSALPADRALALTAMLRRFGDAAQRLTETLFPAYAGSLERARTSFRPAEVAGRPASLRQDDRRLHVDSFPSQPMRGRRILRVFANIAPDGAPRIWRVGEAFEDHARRFLPKVRPPLPGETWLPRWMGLTKGYGSLYDHLMLGLHDAAKRDEAYQAEAEATTLRFEAGTAWTCFTDQVPHAVISGHCALEQTFHLPVSAMLAPELSPRRVLETLTGRAVV
jgi:hypothetical protein